MPTTVNSTRPIVLSQLVERTKPHAAPLVADGHPVNPPALTFPQVRAKLANTAYRTLTHLDICKRLRAAGVAVELPATRRALAWALAWALLPGGSERAKGGRS